MVVEDFDNSGLVAESCVMDCSIAIFVLPANTDHQNLARHNLSETPKSYFYFQVGVMFEQKLNDFDVSVLGGSLERRVSSVDRVDLLGSNFEFESLELF